MKKYFLFASELQGNDAVLKVVELFKPLDSPLLGNKVYRFCGRYQRMKKKKKKKKHLVLVPALGALNSLRCESDKFVLAFTMKKHVNIYILLLFGKCTGAGNENGERC